VTPPTSTRRQRRNARREYFLTLVALWIIALGSLYALAADAKAPIIPRGQTFTCTPTLVWDGDGPIWCAEGPKIRLAGINAREHDETCRPNAPCPKASGRAARDYLVKLLGGPRGTTRTGHIRVAGPPLRCRSDGWGKGDRTAAWCLLSSGADLSKELVASTTVTRWAYRSNSEHAR
jgi:endonuclease YncB( thermonuclease family)